ncbi:MAG: MarR family transcriptional regulator [Anaerolineae bacterium]
MEHLHPQKSAVILQQYQLIHDIYVMLDDGDQRVLRPFGLTMPQYRVLASLDEDHGQRLTTLSERLIRAKSTITRIIDQLESNGLVERAVDDEDRRAQRVVLTPAGAELLHRARLAHQESLAWRMNAALTADEQQAFCALLSKLHDSLVETLAQMG